MTGCFHCSRIVAFYHWLGKKLVAEKDIYIAFACAFFFLHLLLLQVVHEISDDLGIAQGVLLSGYAVLVQEYPKLLHIIGFSIVLTILLAILNTPQTPAAIDIPAAAPQIPASPRVPAASSVFFRA